MSTMLLQIYRSLLLFIVVVAQWMMVLVDGSQNKDWNDEGPKPFVFTLQQSCNDWVVFTWDTNHKDFPASFAFSFLTSCEIMYMNQQSLVAKLVMVDLHPDSRTIKLSRLNISIHYAASMTCNETLTSNTVHFVTGFPCTSTEIKEYKAAQWHPVSAHNNTEVLRRPVDVASADNEYSVTDMVLGLFFAICGSTVIACFGYYYWKKRRHRQRILRIFGQSHADPFLALHTPSDQPTSSF